MIDKRFYEHKEQDPAKNMIGVVLLTLVILLMSLWIGSTIAANELGCPRWLSGAYRAGSSSVCYAGPVQGVIWAAQYEMFPSARVRRAVARWPRRYREALAIPGKSILVGLVLSALIGVSVAVGTARRQRAQRPMHKGTRFWASDEEVFGTGLAVNYRPPLTKRIGRWLRG